ncbi:hypothetical protein IFT59_07210 [Rhizobium sp. CFBP 8752]|uniref:hypothetical protein n=1 Tax=Rhizobium sp. CFBP 8752 TaxID=2775301 RepID=UPI0017813BD7|nr:hypothetical protein [Rhizobium sp. CFBP 8752]MBD8663040.1 hypothetical protein [Rhizobium sp. CFBP 8752]
MRENPFWLPAHQRAVGRYEFDAFVETARDELKRCTEDFKRFKPLEDAYGLTTSFSDKDRFQINFGKRKSDFRDMNGNMIIEKGATLLYSLGIRGEVATMLYGANSDSAKMQEKLIYLRIGHFSAHQLRSKMHRDIRDLVAYAYCSSVDTEPTFGERVRVWFIRRFCPRYVDDKFTTAEGYDWVFSTTRAAMMAILKPLATAALIALFTLLGLDYFTDLFNLKG